MHFMKTFNTHTYQTKKIYSYLGLNIFFSFSFFLSKLYQVSVPQENFHGASLVAQWLRICLPMQGTRVRALVWEDPTCRGATRPVSHNY